MKISHGNKPGLALSHHNFCMIIAKMRSQSAAIAAGELALLNALAAARTAR